MINSTKEREFLKRLLDTFKSEASEQLSQVSADLIRLEKNLPSEEVQRLIEKSFREVHSLKGAARAVNQEIPETLCHALEDVFAALKKKTLTLTTSLLNLLHEATDFLKGNLRELSDEEQPNLKANARTLTARLRDAAQGNTLAASDAGDEVILKTDQEPFSPVYDETEAATIRVDPEKLNTFMLQLEELLLVKLLSGNLCAGIRELETIITERHKQARGLKYPLPHSLSETKERADDSEPPHVQYVRLTGELSGKISGLSKTADQNLHQIGRLIDDLLGEGRTLAMQPFSSILEIFPKLVRDLTRQQNKEAELIIKGGEIEVDRRIGEEIKDILIHILRNCVDHGLETPQERLAKMKKARGRISLTLTPREGKRLEIVVSDDGAGIGTDRVKAAAVKKGIISSADADGLSDSDAMQLIFASGISTSPIITEISGRGLGLAIIREKIEKLGGSISLESAPNQGTSFLLLMPLTMTALRCLLVTVQDRQFLMPIRNVLEVRRIERSRIRTVENREFINFNGENVGIVRLADLLALKGKSGDGNGRRKYLQTVIAQSGGKRLALEVDEIGEEQEIILKALGSKLLRVKHISGAATLGNMKVLPVLNVPELIATAMKTTRPAGTPVTLPPEEAKGSVLVADDSITSRSLIKNILEASGYKVKTAVDGAEAFLLLKEGQFDLLVSDVDMPNLNGFELTAKIRSDKTLGEIPVILVTALSSREDRERGIDVGANAYIVKGDFDQSNLLEMIERFI